MSEHDVGSIVESRPRRLHDDGVHHRSHHRAVRAKGGRDGDSLVFDHPAVIHTHVDHVDPFEISAGIVRRDEANVVPPRQSASGECGERLDIPA